MLLVFELLFNLGGYQPKRGLRSAYSKTYMHLKKGEQENENKIQIINRKLK